MTSQQLQDFLCDHFTAREIRALAEDLPDAAKLIHDVPEQASRTDTASALIESAKNHKVLDIIIERAQARRKKRPPGSVEAAQQLNIEIEPSDASERKISEPVSAAGVPKGRLLVCLATLTVSLLTVVILLLGGLDLLGLHDLSVRTTVSLWEPAQASDPRLHDDLRIVTVTEDVSVGRSCRWRRPLTQTIHTLTALGPSHLLLVARIDGSEPCHDEGADLITALTELQLAGTSVILAATEGTLASPNVHTNLMDGAASGAIGWGIACGTRSNGRIAQVTLAASDDAMVAETLGRPVTPSAALRTWLHGQNHPLDGGLAASEYTTTITTGDPNIIPVPFFSVGFPPAVDPRCPIEGQDTWVVRGAFVASALNELLDRRVALDHDDLARLSPGALTGKTVVLGTLEAGAHEVIDGSGRNRRNEAQLSADTLDALLEHRLLHGAGIMLLPLSLLPLGAGLTWIGLTLGLARRQRLAGYGLCFTAYLACSFSVYLLEDRTVLGVLEGLIVVLTTSTVAEMLRDHDPRSAE